MSTYHSSSYIPSFPRAIWLHIFQTATFITGEWDVPATTMYPLQEGLLSGLYENVLPLRRTIVQVSRAWWEIGSEVLYASFYERRTHRYTTEQTFRRFWCSLSSRPALGQFVKRVVLSWKRPDSILQLCPNLRILRFRSIPMANRRDLGPKVLPSRLRVLAIAVRNLSQKEIVRVITLSLSVEAIYLSNLREGDEESRHDQRLCLPSVRVLSLNFYDGEAAEHWNPLLSTADLPRLISLSVNRARTMLPFSLDTWKRITSFRKPMGEVYDLLKPELFHSLTHLHLEVLGQPLQLLQRHFPFHQLHHLMLFRINTYYSPVGDWKGIAEKLLALPLDRSKMPLLRILELRWVVSGISDRCRLMEEQPMEPFLACLESAALEFERLGVQFLERDSYRVLNPVKDVVEMVWDQVRINSSG